ncbi:MAG: immunoglobulin domain-containing protein [Phycisphaerae bacterium]
MTFDADRGVVVLFGGWRDWVSSGCLGDTWEFGVPCSSPVVTTQPTARTTCAGSSVSLTAAFSGTSPTLQWRKNGVRIFGATSASLTLAAPSLADAGTYDCVATNACGSVTTAAAELTVQTAPTITTQPFAQALVPGATASFSIAAEGSGLAYQWRRNGTALTSGGRVSGATTSSLSITAVTSADQGTYDCVVTGVCGSVTSSTAALSCTPVFTQQPEGGEFPGGSTITLSTGVSTAGTTTYRWRKNGVALFNSLSFSGTTTPTLVINANDPNDSGEYTLSVTNACGTTLSTAAVVEVTCLSDFNRDGGVDGEDLFAFFMAWEGGLSEADTNQDGGIDGGDVNAFFAKWEAGC